MDTDTQTTPALLPPDTRGPLRRPRPKEMQDMQRHVVEMQRYPIGSPERDRLEKAFLTRWVSFATFQTQNYRGPDIPEEDLNQAAIAAMMLAIRQWREFDPVTGLRGRPVDCWIRRACKWAAARQFRDSQLLRSRHFSSKRDLVSIQPGPVPESARHAVSEDALIAPDSGDDDVMQQRLEAWDRLPENYKQALLEEHGKAKRTMSVIKRRTLVKLAMLRLEGAANYRGGGGTAGKTYPRTLQGPQKGTQSPPPNLRGKAPAAGQKPR